MWFDSTLGSNGDKTPFINVMTTTKQRTNAQTTENQSLTVKSVMVNAKQSAVFLVPDMTEGQKLAVVDEGVLKFLKSLLPSASSYDIVSNLINRLDDVRRGKDMLENAVKECQDFVAFHTTVNLLKTYFDPKTTVEVEKPFNQTPEPPTLEEMIKERDEMSSYLDGLEKAIIDHPNYGMPEPKVAVNH